ncbi:MAG: ribosome silencing factor [Muribaculaceae bacterium]|nr:ribosome silencing factor [Muribaculaceae bacterium]MDE6771868.1 ribosome silencing factor [Muribaculaceae bacterium]
MHGFSDIQNNIIEAITDKKGKKIAVIDLSEIDGASTDRLIICQGNSTSQVAAIADSVRDRLLDECKIKPMNYEGYRNSQWIVIDYGDTMVHVFLPDFREFYSLESLWNDAPASWIPDVD